MASLPIRFHLFLGVWGDAYTDLFLKVVLPNHLSPGNLLSFKSRSHSVYKIYTTSRDAATIANSPIFAKLSKTIRTELVNIDDIDLNQDKYEALIEFHQRAIQAADDDGAALIILAPDNIWSEGTFPRVEKVAEAGKRLMIVGGLRVVRETFVPAFLDRYASASELAAPIFPRDLVRLSLDHLHPISNNNFLDSPEFTPWPAMLYWRVDEEGILARAYNHHPMMINPYKRGIKAPHFTIDALYPWLACPDPKDIYAVQDSDECIFCEPTFSAEKACERAPNVASVPQIANWVKNHANPQHRYYATFPVRFHADECSARWAAVERHSAEIVASIGSLIEEPATATQAELSPGSQVEGTTVPSASPKPKASRLGPVLSEFRDRLGALRQHLRGELQASGGLRNRAELALATVMAAGIKLGAVAAKCLRPPLWLARGAYRRARRLLVAGSLPCAPAAPPAPPTPGEQLAAWHADYPRRTFSALLCNYNDAPFLERAILSVVTQSRPPDEYLLMDDGSTDNSADIMEQYAAQYPFIKVIRKKKNEGYLKGICELTEMASGEWLHRGASDDYMLPGFIENMMQLAEVFPHAGIVTGELSGLGIPGWGTGYVSGAKYLHDYLEVGDPICNLAPATIFRKAAVQELGGWRRELGFWDITLILHACALKHGMGYLDMPVYTWVYRKKAWTQRDNSDFERSIGVSKTFLRLMRSPPFRDLFGDKFPEMWFKASIVHSARHVANDLYECSSADAA